VPAAVLLLDGGLPLDPGLLLQATSTAVATTPTAPSLMRRTARLRWNIIGCSLTGDSRIRKALSLLTAR
jgi:hypothetical protein